MPELVGGSVRTNVAIAVPVMPGDPVGRQVAEVIASDLRSTGLFTPLGPERPARLFGRGSRQPGLSQLAQRRRRRAGVGLYRAARRRPDDRLPATSTTSPPAAAGQSGIRGRRHPTGAGPRTNAPTWSIRACRGSSPISTRASSTSPRPAPRTTARSASRIMDSDGSNHRYLTVGRNTVVTPRFSPRGDKLVYVSLYRPPAARAAVRRRERRRSGC